MAEAVGLAFGGVALAGLVSSCVDIIEYISSAQNWLCDLNLALTKVALLHCRLDHLREICLAAAAIGHDKSGDTCDVAAQGLSGVKSVLEQTNKLCRRYSLAHTQDGEYCHAAHRSLDLQSSLLVATQLDRPQLTTLKPWQRLGRQLSWALQDKKKFDKLIADLDFLLSNTEQLFRRAATLIEPVHRPQESEKTTHVPSHPHTASSSQIFRSQVSKGTSLDSPTVSYTWSSQESMSPQDSHSEKRKKKAVVTQDKEISGSRFLVNVTDLQSLVAVASRQAASEMHTGGHNAIPSAQGNKFDGNEADNNSKVIMRLPNTLATSVTGNTAANFSHVVVGDAEVPETNPEVLREQTRQIQERIKLMQAQNKGK